MSVVPNTFTAGASTVVDSILFRDAAATPRADETTMLAATLIAQTAYDLFADPELVAAAWKEFHEGQ